MMGNLVLILPLLFGIFSKVKRGENLEENKYNACGIEDCLFKGTPKTGYEGFVLRPPCSKSEGGRTGKCQVRNRKYGSPPRYEITGTGKCHARYEVRNRRYGKISYQVRNREPEERNYAQVRNQSYGQKCTHTKKSMHLFFG